jgi:hypothetical protein
MTTQTGFKQDHQGSYIDKDPVAVLVYSLDWNDWIENNDTIANSVMTVSTVANDASPLAVRSSGFTGNVAYAELQHGSAGNVYTVTNTITTTDGAVDARRFRVKVQNRFV